MAFNFEILDKADKKRVLQELKPYGIERISYLLIKAGSRLRIFSGILGKNELINWLRNIKIDNIGLYFASLQEGLRMNIDAVHLLSHQIKHNILEISDAEAEKWFRGNEINLKDINYEKNLEVGFIILKNKEDFIGVGKLSKTKILNFLPKERRIKN